MLIRTLAVVGLVAVSLSAAHAGQITNGVWAPIGCGVDPGKAPEIATKSPEAYNASVKAAQQWQEKTKSFMECLVNEGKNDQGNIVTVLNDHINAFNTSNNDIAAASNEALKKVNGRKAGNAQSPHNN